MSAQPEQAKREIEELLERVDESLVDARTDYYRIEDLAEELQIMLERKTVSQFKYDIRYEQLRRDYESSGEHLKHLERQRKLLLYHLHKLG